MHRLLTLTALGLLCALAAHAQPTPMPQSINVILPDGTALTIVDIDGAPWWKDPRILPYDRYVFDPAHSAYRVYSDKEFKGFEKKWGGEAGPGNRRAGTDEPRPPAPGIVAPLEPGEPGPR